MSEDPNCHPWDPPVLEGDRRFYLFSSTCHCGYVSSSPASSAPGRNVVRGRRLELRRALATLLTKDSSLTYLPLDLWTPL